MNFGRADRVPALAAYRDGPQDRAAGDGQRVADVVDQGARGRSAGPSHRYSWPGCGEQPVRAVARLVEDAGQDPGAGRAEQPHQDVAGDPRRPPQQALDGEHHVDEEDRRAPPSGRRRSPAAEQPAPIRTAHSQVWVRVRCPPVRRGSPVHAGRLVDGVRELVDDLAQAARERAEGPRDGRGLVVEVRGERRARADQRSDDERRARASDGPAAAAAAPTPSQAAAPDSECAGPIMVLLRPQCSCRPRTALR